MKKYIDKSALVAELDKLYNLEYDNTSDLSCGKKIMLRDILLFLNTLEVKDVDLEKEIELIKGDYEQVDVAWNNDFDYIAKYFFELGLKAQKGE